MDAMLLETEVRQVAEPLSDLAALRREFASLRQEVLQLRCEVGYWKSRHADAVRRNEKLKQELAAARAEIRQLKADRFGKKSEKQDRSNELTDPQAQNTTRPRRRGQQPQRPGPQRRDYSHLPVQETFVDLPPEESVCDCCGKPLVEQADTVDSEQLEVEITVFRRRYRRRRYRRTCDCPGPRTRTAEVPPKLIPKSRLGLSLWVHLLLEKFHAQRPIERTIEQLRWYDLELSPGTIASGLQRIEPLLTPIYEALCQRSAASVYHQADETRWAVFDEIDGKKGYRWWLWLFVAVDSIVYRLDPSRSREVPQNHFSADAPGVLMVDRYSAYKAMQQVKAGSLRLAFCWAHVRRDFVRVGKGFPEHRAWALAWLQRIRELYHLDRARRASAPDSAEYASADAALRKHIVVMEQQRDQELGETKQHDPCHKALASLGKHWPGLTLFLDDDRIPLDNNYAERLMRNPALGRKNYYGSGSQWSARLAMMMFSILATLKLWKLNPRLWLNEYLQACAVAGGKPPPDIQRFLPWNLSDEQRTALAGTAQASDCAAPT